MPHDLELTIHSLLETNDPAKAFFSFTVDDTGENGIIKANKEGLRLYAAEILKKSIELEQCQNGKPLYFLHPEWLISDADYDLICGIQPQYGTRAEILQASQTTRSGSGKEPFGNTDNDQSGKKGCFFSLFLLGVGGLILFAAHKAFPTLQL